MTELEQQISDYLDRRIDETRTIINKAPRSQPLDINRLEVFEAIRDRFFPWEEVSLDELVPGIEYRFTYVDFGRKNIETGVYSHQTPNMVSIGSWMLGKSYLIKLERRPLTK